MKSSRALLMQVKAIIFVLMLSLLAGCGSTPNESANINDICSIFSKNPRWYKAAKKSSDKWGAPIYLPMAIMYQESRFKAKARPPKKYALGFIPRGRASDAYGYAQALKSTWAEYEKATGKSAKRTKFADAYDFVQWYMDVTHKRNNVSKLDANAHYLNYHEGQGGYARGTFKKKQWLINVAAKVNQRSDVYAKQLSRCEPKFRKSRRVVLYIRLFLIVAHRWTTAH